MISNNYELVTQKSGIFSSNTYNDFKSTFQSSNLYNRSDIEWYTKFNRFGCIDPYNALTGTKEYLFFTKPDLHLCTPRTTTLNKQLSNSDFFVELSQRYPDVIAQLQKSIQTEGGSQYTPFMPILSNSVKNALDMPEISANVIDTAATIFGTSIDYRGDAFNAGEKYEFSLEFEDTKYLELYHFFKAYEEYEQLKKIGIVTPPNINFAPEYNGYAFSRYLDYRELHDQFSIFKFIVDDDYQDIIYYAMLVGVFPKSVPREAFGNLDPSGGLRYNVNFEAQFVDDMKPYILIMFNNLITSTMSLSSTPEWLEVYNDDIEDVDGTWARTPFIVRQYRDDTRDWLGPKSMQYLYQLKWRMR